MAWPCGRSLDDGDAQPPRSTTMTIDAGSGDYGSKRHGRDAAAPAACAGLTPRYAAPARRTRCDSERCSAAITAAHRHLLGLASAARRFARVAHHGLLQSPHDDYPLSDQSLDVFAQNCRDDRQALHLLRDVAPSVSRLPRLLVHQAILTFQRGASAIEPRQPLRLPLLRLYRPLRR